MAAVAHLRGYDLADDEVRNVVLLTLLGSGGTEVLRGVVVTAANKIAAA